MTTCLAWKVPAYADVPQEVVARAVAIKDAPGAYPMNADYDEEHGGKLWRFHVRMHPPNSSNPIWHRGVDVEVCAHEEIVTPPVRPAAGGSGALAVLAVGAVLGLGGYLAYEAAR